MTPPKAITEPVAIPAELLARMEEMKKYRDRDRDRAINDIIYDLCADYVRVLERVASLAARKDELERSYEEEPYDCRENFYGTNTDQPGREG